MNTQTWTLFVAYLGILLLMAWPLGEWLVAVADCDVAAVIIASSASADEGNTRGQFTAELAVAVRTWYMPAGTESVEQLTG